MDFKKKIEGGTEKVLNKIVTMSERQLIGTALGVVLTIILLQLALFPSSSAMTGQRLPYEPWTPTPRPTLSRPEKTRQAEFRATATESAARNARLSAEYASETASWEQFIKSRATPTSP